MASGTQVTQAELIATRTEILNMDQETDGELRKLRAAAMSLRSDNWRSTLSGKSFDETMNQWDQDAAAMRRALQEIAQLMQTTVDGYDTTEHDNVRAVKIQSGDGTSYDLGR
jgi:WXG100 family type VII secretion target